MADPNFLLAESASVVRIGVHSSNVDSVGYANAGRRLYVWFQKRAKGAVVGTTLYAYLDCEPELHIELMSSASKGMHVYHKLRSLYPDGDSRVVKLGDGGPPVGTVKAI